MKMAGLCPGQIKNSKNFSPMSRRLTTILPHLALALMLLFAAGCGKKTKAKTKAKATAQATATEAKPSRTIFVSIAPQREAVERIAGGCGWKVEVLVPSGASPESFSPDARSLEALSRAQMLFTIGVPMEEALLPKVASLAPALKLFDATIGMKKESFEGDAGDGIDPHVWLRVLNMELFASQVASELARLEPEHANAYYDAYIAYSNELKALDKALSAQLAPLKGKPLLAYHPAFGYFIRSYGMTQLSIEREGKEPTGGYLNQVLATAKAAAVPVIFIQPQFNPKPAQALAAELGCQVAVLNPLPEHYLQDVAEMGTIIANAYGVQEDK